MTLYDHEQQEPESCKERCLALAKWALFGSDTASCPSPFQDILCRVERAMRIYASERVDAMTAEAEKAREEKP